MANYVEASTGGAIVEGVSWLSVLNRFGTDELLLRKDKALKGILEKVVIKSVRFTKQGAILYTDTMNAWWFEEDLVRYSEGVELAKAYPNR